MNFLLTLELQNDERIAMALSAPQAARGDDSSNADGTK